MKKGEIVERWEMDTEKKREEVADSLKSEMLQ